MTFLDGFWFGIGKSLAELTLGLSIIAGMFVVLLVYVASYTAYLWVKRTWAGQVSWIKERKNKLGD